MVSGKGPLPHITFVIHDVEGGIASMNHQIIENAPFREYFQVHILLWKAEEKKAKGLRYSFENADTVRHFSYSVSDNHYHTLQRLHRLLHEFPGLVVTNDGLELEACRKFGTRSVLFSIVHDFYNLRLAIGNLDLVDYFLCHTEVFTRALLSSHSLEGRVAFLLHGVKIPVLPVSPAPSAAGVRARERLRIVSISRLTESKGVLLLAGIDDQLRARSIGVDWVVIGSGELEASLQEQWAGKDYIRFYKPDKPEEVIALAADCDIFISPSHFEGYGIALLEAMSCGLVPLIYRLPVGVYSDLPENVGFSMEIGDLQGFADRIASLADDRALLAVMSENARNLVVQKYDIRRTANDFLEYFSAQSTVESRVRGLFKEVTNFGIFDQPYIPNFLTRIIKKIRSRNNNL